MRLLEAFRLGGNGKHHIVKVDDEVARTGLCGTPLPLFTDYVDESTVPEWARCKSCFKFYAGGSR